MTRALAIAALICCAAPAPAFCQFLGLMEEEADCEGDAFRFCSQYILNHAQIHACLYAYRNSISPACRAIIAPRRRGR